jgi:hypothetical protein
MQKIMNVVGCRLQIFFDVLQEINDLIHIGGCNGIKYLSNIRNGLGDGVQGIAAR